MTAAARSESDPGVLEEAAVAFSRAPVSVDCTAGVALARRLAALGSEDYARRAAAAVWGRSGDPAMLAETASLLFPSAKERDAALSLRAQCLSPDFHIRLSALFPTEGFLRRLASAPPLDDRMAVHWMTGVCFALDARGSRLPWIPLEFLIADLGACWDEGPALTPAARADRLRTGALALARADWTVPALAQRRFAAVLAECRRVVVRQAARALAFAEASASALAQGVAMRDEADLPEMLGRTETGVREALRAVDLLRAAPSSAEAAALLALAPWPDGWPDSSLAGPLVAALRPEESSAVREALAREPEASGSPSSMHSEGRRAWLLARLDGERALPRLAGIVADPINDFASDAAAGALSALDPSAVAACPELGRERAAWARDEALARPGELRGRLLAGLASRAFRSRDPATVAQNLYATGSAAALAVLREAYRPGEPKLAAAALALADLHGAELPEREAMTRDEAGPEPGPLTVRLRCGACRWAYRYAVNGVDAADFDGEQVSFDRLIRCKRCGAIEDYELCDDTAHAVRLGCRVAAENDDSLNHWDREVAAAFGGRTKFIRGYATAGAEFATKRCVHGHLRRKAAERPEDPDSWRRLGAFYLQGGLATEAEAAYRTALELAPRDERARAGLERARGSSA